MTTETRIKPPWFFCCGWWSPWCVLDVIGHRIFYRREEGSCLPRPFNWICDKHDDAIMREPDGNQD